MSQDAVAVLIANPIVTVSGVYICDECIAGCQSMLERHEAEGAAQFSAIVCTARTPHPNPETGNELCAALLS